MMTTSIVDDGMNDFESTSEKEQRRRNFLGNHLAIRN